MATVRVASVESVDERVLGVVFTDGLVREFDFASCNAGVFAALDDDDTFAAVSVDPVAGTISFPGGIDFDPDVLHGDAPAASRHQPVLIRQYRLEH